jgi:hypothetical protein
MKQLHITADRKENKDLSKSSLLCRKQGLKDRNIPIRDFEFRGKIKMLEDWTSFIRKRCLP